MHIFGVQYKVIKIPCGGVVVLPWEIPIYHSTIKCVSPTLGRNVTEWLRTENTIFIGRLDINGLFQEPVHVPINQGK